MAASAAKKCTVYKKCFWTISHAADAWVGWIYTHSTPPLTTGLRLQQVHTNYQMLLSFGLEVELILYVRCACLNSTTAELMHKYLQC